MPEAGHSVFDVPELHPGEISNLSERNTGWQV